MKLIEVTYVAAERKQLCCIYWPVAVVSYSDLNMSLVERDTTAVRSLGLVWVIDECTAGELEASMKGYRERFKTWRPGNRSESNKSMSVKEAVTSGANGLTVNGMEY